MRVSPSRQRDLQPLVSIIIDNFNYARFVGAAIDSALAQSYAPVEVMVVDDGSTDNSREVISSYGDRVSRGLQAKRRPCFGVQCRISRESRQHRDVSRRR